MTPLTCLRSSGDITIAKLPRECEHDCSHDEPLKTILELIMGIAKRATNPSPPTQTEMVSTHTRGEVEDAAHQIAKLMGQPLEWEAECVGFACVSASTADALVAFARYQVRCVAADMKLADGRKWKEANALIADFDQTLEGSALADQQTETEALDMPDGEEKDLAVKEAKKRLLYGVGGGTMLHMSVDERWVVVKTIAPVFAPPADTPLARKLFEQVVGRGWGLRMADWLIRNLSEEADLAEYEAALENAKPKRRQARKATQAQADADAGAQVAQAAQAS